MDGEQIEQWDRRKFDTSKELIYGQRLIYRESFQLFPSLSGFEGTWQTFCEVYVQVVYGLTYLHASHTNKPSFIPPFF